MVNWIEVAEDDNVYTEDYVKVYKIFIQGISKQKFTTDQFYNTFAKFGKILEFEFFERDKDENSAFIYYEKSEDAARVLKEPCWVQKNKFACYSWEQPNANFQQVPYICNTSNLHLPSQTDEANILKLNDDCLAHICQFLELKYQIRFALCCQRFQRAFFLCPKVIAVDQNLFEKLTLWEVRELLQLTGATINKLDFRRYNHYFKTCKELLPVYTKNLTVLRLKFLKIKLQYLREIVTNLQQLKELEMMYCVLTDEHIELLQNLHQLNKLNISENNYITGVHLASLHTVQHLSLSNCESIELQHLVDIFRALTNLQTLDINSNELVYNEEFFTEILNCNCLKALTFRCNNSQWDFITSIATLPALTSLSAELGYIENCSPTLVANLLTALIQHKAHHLQQLEILLTEDIFGIAPEIPFGLISKMTALTDLRLFEFNSMTDDHFLELCALKNLQHFALTSESFINSGVFKLIQSCSKLEHVNVRYCCGITNDLVWQLIKHQEFFVRCNRSLKLDLYYTNADQNIVKHPTYLNAQFWLSLSFQP